MPSTFGWLAVAIAAGSLAGVTIGRWPVVAGWLHRCLEDPVGRPHDADRVEAHVTSGRTRASNVS